MATADHTPARDDARANSYLANHPDRELIILGHELEAAIGLEMANGFQAGMSDEAHEAMIKAHGAIANAIAAHRPHTLRGLAVQARALKWCGGIDAPKPDDATETVLIRQIVNWLLSPVAGGKPSAGLANALEAVHISQEAHAAALRREIDAEGSEDATATEAGADATYSASVDTVDAFMAKPCANETDALWLAYHAMALFDESTDRQESVRMVREGLKTFVVTA